MLRAVIFDCDGVLVDSEPLESRTWEDVTARHGYAITHADYEACLGHNDRFTYDYLAAKVPLPPWDEFIAEIRRVDEERYPAQLKAFPDAYEAVRALAAQGVPLAVASSSPRWRVDLALSITDLARYFDAIVAGDGEWRGRPLAGKPAPDIYLAAAASLGVPPEDCFAVEDSSAGVAAAEAAGMRVVAVVRPHTPVPRGAGAVNTIDADLILTWMGLR